MKEFFLALQSSPLGMIRGDFRSTHDVADFPDGTSPEKSYNDLVILFEKDGKLLGKWSVSGKELGKFSSYFYKGEHPTHNADHVDFDYRPDTDNYENQLLQELGFPADQVIIFSFHYCYSDNAGQYQASIRDFMDDK